MSRALGFQEMVMIFEGSIDKDCVRYEHHSMVLFYLSNAKRHADLALEHHQEGFLQADSISAIIFSAMSVEAFLNETAENFIEKECLDDFSFLRNAYKTKGRLSSVTKKVSIIFKVVFEVDLPNDLLASVEELVRLRNNLVHYKLSDTATKLTYPPLKSTVTERDEPFMCVDFMQEPKTVMPPFVQGITGSVAMKSYQIAHSVLMYWDEQVKDKNDNPIRP